MAGKTTQTRTELNLKGLRWRKDAYSWNGTTTSLVLFEDYLPGDCEMDEHTDKEDYEISASPDSVESWTLYSVSNPENAIDRDLGTYADCTVEALGDDWQEIVFAFNQSQEAQAVEYYFDTVGIYVDDYKVEVYDGSQATWYMVKDASSTSPPGSTWERIELSQVRDVTKIRLTFYNSSDTQGVSMDITEVALIRTPPEIVTFKWLFPFIKKDNYYIDGLVWGNTRLALESDVSLSFDWRIYGECERCDGSTATIFDTGTMSEPFTHPGDGTEKTWLLPFVDETDEPVHVKATDRIWVNVDIEPQVSSSWTAAVNPNAYVYCRNSETSHDFELTLPVVF